MNNMKLIMESFNKFVNEQTGAEMRQKLDKEIEALEKKIKEASAEEKAKLEKQLADKKAALKKLDDSVPGHDPYLESLKKDD